MDFGVDRRPTRLRSGVIAWTGAGRRRALLRLDLALAVPCRSRSGSTRGPCPHAAMTVGPMVTNPGTRDWSVTASLFATLNDMYGNRTVCGIGRGDSARRVIGQPPMTLATLSDAMTVIRGLAEGREVTHHGQPLRIPWVRNGKLEIWMAAYGPKALKLTGEQADGFILQTADPDIARWTIGSVRSAAEAAGRDPSSITICVAAPGYVGTDLAHQREQLRWFGGMVGNHVADLVARYGTDGPVPAR